MIHALKCNGRRQRSKNDKAVAGRGGDCANFEIEMTFSSVVQD